MGQWTVPISWLSGVTISVLNRPSSCGCRALDSQVPVLLGNLQGLVRIPIAARQLERLVACNARLLVGPSVVYLVLFLAKI